MRSPFKRMFCKAWGKIFRRNSERENFQSSTIRMHLMPPEVDPPPKLPLEEPPLLRYPLLRPEEEVLRVRLAIVYGSSHWCPQERQV